MRRARRNIHARRAFTLLELMVALGLSLVVMAAALAIFSMVPLVEQRNARLFDEQLDLLIAQAVVRDAMDTLVGAKPIGQEEIDELTTQALLELQRANDDQGNEGDSNEEQPDGLTEDRQWLLDVARRAGGDSEVLRELLEESAFTEMPNFELHYETNAYGTTLGRLEVVLQQSPLPVRDEPRTDRRPAPGPRASAMVRGAFELIQIDDELILQWQPIDPPGLGVTLVPNLAWCEWWALPRRVAAAGGTGWLDVAAAYLEEDYPVAIRLVMWTRAGSQVDWLFETNVITPGAG